MSNVEKINRACELERKGLGEIKALNDFLQEAFEDTGRPMKMSKTEQDKAIIGYLDRASGWFENANKYNQELEEK